MPPRHINPSITRPDRALDKAPTMEKPRGVSRLLGSLGFNSVRTTDIPPTVEYRDLHMNIAETYGVAWDVEKCARDALQNFFDANGGTLDGVEVELDDRAEGRGYWHDVTLRGRGSYDYRDLALLGATTKKTGEQTAGGFGEGAKILSLALLRDHSVERVVYRSADWQLEFYLAELPDDKAARPTRGLMARVATGLDTVQGSEMMIACRTINTAEAIVKAKELFRSSENPDFQDMTIEKTLEDGSQVGVKFLGTQQTWREELVGGNLYVAGQRREFSQTGDPHGWGTVRGLSVYTTKDIASGDRDRGAITHMALEYELFKPMAAEMTASEVEGFLKAIEPAYASSLLGSTELDDLAHYVADRGEKLDVRMEFPEKYIACRPLLDYTIQRMLTQQGFALCPDYFRLVGMRTSDEVIKRLHDHQRIEPTPEHEKKIAILAEALDILKDSFTKKEFIPKEVALYSRADENSPAHGSHSEAYVWLAVEHMTDDFARVFATYLHELDHTHGTDQSASFSYALTDTLAAVLAAVSGDANVASRWQALAQQWDEARREAR